MIQHSWSLICNRCITDPTSKNVTLVEVLEQINAPPGTVFPIMAPIQMDFVSTWYRSDPNQGERGTARVVVKWPNGGSSDDTQFAVDLTSFYRARIVTRSAGIKLVGPGIYYFTLDLKQDGEAEWRNVARIPLSVAIAEGAITLQGGALTMQ
jgi:hypothetical protein